MNALRNVGLIALGMLLAYGLLLAGGAALAQGTMGDLVHMAAEPMGFTGGWGDKDSDGHHGMMGDHGQFEGMHHGEGTPAECLEAMGDAETAEQMVQLMHGDESLNPEEWAAWMEEHGCPAEDHEECLEAHEECSEYMDHSGMMGHMMQAMHGEGPVDPEAWADWMAEHDCPADAHEALERSEGQD